jgi:hypothetical protein
MTGGLAAAQVAEGKRAWQEVVRKGKAAEEIELALAEARSERAAWVAHI